MPFTQIHLSDTAMYNTSLVPRKRNQPPGIYPGKLYIIILHTIHNSLWCHLVVTVVQYNMNLQATAPPGVHYFMQWPHKFKRKKKMYTQVQAEF